MKNLALHWQILIGMVLGVAAGLLLGYVDWGKGLITDWVKPIGTIFIKLLKLIAIPLIIASLIKGIADLKDISKFSSIGKKTILLYLMSTVIAISIGLLFVNVINPGDKISSETIAMLKDANQADASKRVESAFSQKDKGPLQFVVDMVPDNIFSAASDNRNMLQVIFFVVFFGISILLIPEEQSRPIREFFNSLNEVIMKMIDLIMLMAPYAVFALLSSLVVETKNPDLFYALAWYGFAVIAGLLTMVIVYITIVKVYTGRSPGSFLNGISPAQLLAFSTSSSAATLPVTMERVEEHLGVDKEVASFVCPVGATVNMDGTSLYQAVAAVFICQALDYGLTLPDQLTIVLTATLASIGSAAVPGAGMVMLVIVLDSLGVPKETLMVGLALIFAIDRPLDMLRTVINVTGDATVAMIVAHSEGKLNDPNVKDWDDHYKKE